MAAKRTERRKGPLIIGCAVAALLISGFVWFVHTMMAAKTNKSQRQVQVVQLIRPPPPPPPPEQPPPPPEKTEVPLPKDEPTPAPENDEPPPAEPMGLDAQGSAGSDAFGFGARHGGSDLIGGNGTSVFGWYTSRLKDAVVERLSNDARIGAKKFSVTVRVWIEPDGRIKEIKLVSTSGNRELDQRIEAALSSMTRLSDSPPLEMPQPVSLKIVSRI
jgi:protein TonB